MNSNRQNERKRIYKPVPLLDGIEEIKQDFEERIEKGDVTYGIEILDDCVETIRKGSVTCIVAAPNTGKSAWALNIAVHLAKQNKKILICSCEMGAGLLMERQIVNLLGTTSGQLKELYENRRDTANKLMNTLITDEKYKYLNNIDICETGGATVNDLLDMFEAFPEFEFIVIDYIQRVRGVGEEYEIITDAFREIQTYARDTGKMFIVCSQASRSSNADAKYGKVINTDKIRGKGSGSIEEDSDVGVSLLEIEEDCQRYILANLFKNRYSNKKNITYKYLMDYRMNLRLQQRGV